MFPVLGALPDKGLRICNTTGIYDSRSWYLPKTILSLGLACPKAPTLVMELHTWMIWRSDNLKSDYTLFTARHRSTPRKGLVSHPKIA